MDEARLRDRLDRIDVLGRSGASQAEVLAELRGLVREAEGTAAAAAGDGGGGGRAPTHGAARDIIGE